MDTDKKVKMTLLYWHRIHIQPELIETTIAGMETFNGKLYVCVEVREIYRVYMCVCLLLLAIYLNTEHLFTPAIRLNSLVLFNPG